MKSATFVTVLMFVFVCSAAAQNHRRDGNWWIQQDELSRMIYVTGFFDGMELGNLFSYWEMPPKDVKKDAVDCSAIALNSYFEMKKKYLGNVTSGQLAEGLSKFYSDYRNRSIKVHAAAWIVANSIAGISETEYNKMVEGWRRNASEE